MAEAGVDEATVSAAAARTGAVDPDRLMPASQLRALAELTTAQLRERRADCEAAEAGVSYARRLLQGRLDILRAELASREHPDAEDVLASLPAILSQDAGPAEPRQVRSTRLAVPPDAAAYESAVESALPGADLQHLDVTGLRSALDRLAAHERDLSVVRRALFRRVDALRDELAARYKDGRADVGELLRSRPGGPTG